MTRDVIVWTHTIVHFLADFCLDVKAERVNVWGPFIVVGWEQPHPNEDNVEFVPEF